MTQTQEPKPSVTLDSLRQRSADLSEGIAGLQKNLAAIEQQATKIRNDLIATTGARQFVDQLVAMEDKKIADAKPVAEPSAV